MGGTIVRVGSNSILVAGKRPHEGMVLVGGSIASQRVFMWEAIAEELKTPSYSYRPNQVVELVPPLSRGSFPHLMPKETIGLMRTDSRIQ